MAITAAAIPYELILLDRWLGWIWEWDATKNGGRGKWDKPPANIRGGPGSSTNPATWIDFPTACAAADAEEVDGIGIALGDLGDGQTLCGVDIDDCRNPDTGELTVEAEMIIRTFGGYWEVSPTGTGVKGLFLGDKPRGRCKTGNYEVYGGGKYFTVTGAKLDGCPNRLVDATQSLAWFQATFIEPPKPPDDWGSNKSVDLELVAELVEALNPKRADDYQEWVLVGMALRSVDPAMFPIWDGWSSQSSKYNAAECKQKWDSFNGSGVGIGSLFHWAKEDGWRPKRREPFGDQCTDAANALRFAAQHGDHVRFVGRWKKWLVFTGQRWQHDDMGEVMRRAKRTADAIYAEAAECMNQEQQKALAAWATQSHSRARLEAMIELAKSEKPIPITHDSLDADPWLLNCENGTVDLHTGQLRPHDAGDLITKTTGVEFPDDGGVDASLWGEFLDTIFAGDAELIRFLQRLMGSALVGEVFDHLLPIFYGSGANGKSVFVETIMDALGEYAMKAAAGLLMTSRGERHPTELADLFGQRVVAIIETADGQRLDERLVKETTGGDTIRARRMREDFWQFKPSHLAILVTNHKPIVRGTDIGIWRRLRLVPFTVTIPKERQDPLLKAKLGAELPAILRWLVDGCLAWKREGLNAPCQVLAATEGYKFDNDTFAQWFDEHITLEPSGEIKASMAFRSYSTWCEDTGERPATNRRFGERMAERIAGKRVSNGTWYLGVAWQQGE